MKSLIIGSGQIGNALYEIFSLFHEVYIRDLDELPSTQPQDYSDGILHIAYPYSKTFIEDTRKYVAQYKPRLTMIHSTVKIGTTRELGKGFVHSPERGRFPNLVKEMKTFPKFVAAMEDNDRELAVEFIRACEWDTVACINPDFTEACKLISNSHLGLEIAWRQFVQAIFNSMEDTEAGIEVYKAWERTYCKGLLSLEQYQLIRPRLEAEPIGGHCVLPSMDILEMTEVSPFFDIIRDLNECVKRQKEKARIIGIGNA